MSAQKIEMVLTVEKCNNDLWIISDNLSLNYGDGDTFVDALIDYAASLKKYWEIIEEGIDDCKLRKAIKDIAL